jgi:hypothetical protein
LGGASIFPASGTACLIDAGFVVSTVFGTTDVGVEVVGGVGRLDLSTDLEPLQTASVLMAGISCGEN